MSEPWPSQWADVLDYLDGIGYRDLYLGDAGLPGGAGVAPTLATDPPGDAGVAAAADSTNLAAVAAEASTCTACRLCRGRTQVVFGSGNPEADLMLIGEGPGAEEDRQGLPFVGPAGALLTKILAAIGQDRDRVYIANVVKCRPPGNRDPEPDEVAACRPFLERQIALVKPRVIVALGRVAAQCLLRSGDSLGRLRGRWHEVAGVPARATYHPAALLRNAGWKRPTWEDMQIVRDRLLEEAP
ncbi:MAG: uracil-DNA glycosylase [Thermoanaerobaculia bacterium]